MAYQTINGIMLEYPDDPCLVFNPCKFTLTGNLARTRVYVSHGGQSYNATYQTPAGGTLDLREFMQSFFDGLKMGKDLEQINDFKVSELGKSVSLTIFALSSAGATLAQFNISVFCVWGCTAVGENYETYLSPDHRRLRWYKSFPFTVGIYTETARSIVYSDGGANIRTIALSSKGVYNILIDEAGSTDKVILSDAVSPYTERYVIDIDEEHTEGVYLRWVDRHGFWHYWLFKEGDPNRQAASRFGMWNRNDYSKHHHTYGWQQDAGRRQSYTRTDVLPLCAPLVDQETFDMLQDVTTSPCVDMFLGYDSHDEPTWTAVTVEAGQYTKEAKKPEQDFLLNVILPEIPTQTL